MNIDGIETYLEEAQEDIQNIFTEIREARMLSETLDAERLKGFIKQIEYFIQLAKENI